MNMATMLWDVTIKQLLKEDRTAMVPAEWSSVLYSWTMHALTGHQAHLCPLFSSLLEPSLRTGVQHTLKIGIHVIYTKRCIS